jgi:3-oxoacyl-(acyl-carrier-protein) synthase
MDERAHAAADDLLVLTGFGVALGAACDPTPYLRQRKLRKFMGVQDDLAVVAAGRALESAALAATELGEAAGLYLAVGYIPFEQADIETLYAASCENGRVSPHRFSTDGLAAANPLLTFRCLPNMPAFHVSTAFGIQGPYLVTYPGPAQLYGALDTACAALRAGQVGIALIGGVAHQQNFLVARHFARIEPPTAAERLGDGAGVLVLETPAHATARGALVRGRLLACDHAYRPWDPFADTPAVRECFDAREADLELGPASLPVAVAAATRGRHRHELLSRDGFEAASVWELA